MPATTPSPQERTAIERRNQELLQFQEAAFMLALRLCGNIPDAEDVLQDAYVKAVKAGGAGAEGEPLVTGNDLRNWFLHVTANAARDRFRSEQRRRTRERNAAMNTKTVTTVDVPPGDDAGLRNLINVELSRLDEKMRAPIALHYEQGLSYEEASFVLGVPAATLRVQASRGLEELRQRVAGAGKPVLADVLIGALAVGFVVKTSPALAASITSIVNGTSSAVAAACVAKAPLLIPQSAGMSLLVKAALIALISGAALGTSFAVGYLASRSNQASTPPTSSSSVPISELTAEEQSAVISNTDATKAIVDVRSNAQEAPPVERKTEVVPPLVLDENWDRAVELLPMIDPKRDAVLGNWRLEGASLVGEPARFGRLMAPYEVPREYDLRVEFTRQIGELSPVNGAPSVCVVVSHQNRNFVLRLDCFANGGGYYSDFTKLPQHPDALFNPLLVNGTRYACVIQVRDNSLSAFLDGVPIRTVDIIKSPPELSPDWRLPNQHCVGFGSHVAQVAFHRVALRAVTGQGKAVPPDPDAEHIVSEEYWKDAADLFGQPLTEANTVFGQWTFRNGSASVVNIPAPGTHPAEDARIQFNVIPPEEYDFRVEFSRDAGRYDIGQILSAYGHSFVWKMGVDGLCLLDRVAGVQARPAENPAAVRMPELNVNGGRHVSVVCIRRDHVSCYVDGRLLTSLKTNYADLDVEKNWKLRSPLAIGIGVSEANATFYKAQIKAVKGAVRPLLPNSDKATDDKF